MKNAPITAATPNPSYAGGVLVTADCPFCDKHHTHGIPPQDAGDMFGGFGARVSHCTGIDGVYVLTDPDGLVLRPRTRVASRA